MSSTVRFLVVLVAAIGFLFDTYELLMFPVIGSDAVAELLNVAPTDPVVRLWAGRMLWIAALCGGFFGLLGGWLIDRLGRKTVMIASIFAYSFSPVAASFSTELWMLVVFRCTTFIGVCVEMVAAVTWLAELFQEKRTRELVIGWSLAAASLGGIFVTEVYSLIVAHANELPALPVPERFQAHAAWRYTLLTGLIPGALILLLLPFVPESRVWLDRKRAGTLTRPKFSALFSPELRRTTLVTTILSACGYAAAFGALQLTPLSIVQGLPHVVEFNQEKAAEIKDLQAKLKAAKPDTEEHKTLQADLKKAQGSIPQNLKAQRGNIQRWQELGGLTGRILLAVLLIFVPSRLLIRLFLLPGVMLFPLTYFNLVSGNYVIFATAIFFCGLLTVAQFSYMSEFLPKVFPMHLRGTGGSFATNVGGRMIGTMAATLNTEVLSTMFPGGDPVKVAMGVASAAGIIGGTVYLLALIATFWLPQPSESHG